MEAIIAAFLWHHQIHYERLDKKKDKNMCYSKYTQRKTQKNAGKVNTPALQAALRILEDAGQLKEVAGKYYLAAPQQAIRDTANEFVQKQGFVTTLQIKEVMRKRGFFVKQGDVSEEMTYMHDEGEICVTNVTNPRSGRMHRLFFDASVPEPIAIAAFNATV
jgi:hypothetical protein